MKIQSLCKKVFVLTFALALTFAFYVVAYAIENDDALFEAKLEIVNEINAEFDFDFELFRNCSETADMSHTLSLEEFRILLTSIAEEQLVAREKMYLLEFKELDGYASISSFAMPEPGAWVLFTGTGTLDWSVRVDLTATISAFLYRLLPDPRPFVLRPSDVRHEFFRGVSISPAGAAPLFSFSSVSPDGFWLRYNGREVVGQYLMTNLFFDFGLASAWLPSAHIHIVYRIS